MRTSEDTVKEVIMTENHKNNPLKIEIGLFFNKSKKRFFAFVLKRIIKTPFERIENITEEFHFFLQHLQFRI